MLSPGISVCSDQPVSLSNLIPFLSVPVSFFSVSCQFPDTFSCQFPSPLLSDPATPPARSHVSPVRSRLLSCQIPSPLLSDPVSSPVSSYVSPVSSHLLSCQFPCLSCQIPCLSLYNSRLYFHLRFRLSLLSDPVSSPVRSRLLSCQITSPLLSDPVSSPV